MRSPDSRLVAGLHCGAVVSDETRPRKSRAKTSSTPLEVPRSRRRSSVSPPHGDALGQAHPEVPAVPVDPEPVRPDARRDERIARRAFELFEARGGVNGDSTQDWLEAERQVDAEIAAESNRGG
jgi:hypothetical protein